MLFSMKPCRPMCRVSCLICLRFAWGLACHQDELLAHAFRDLAAHSVHPPTSASLYAAARLGDAAEWGCICCGISLSAEPCSRRSKLCGDSLARELDEGDRRLRGLGCLKESRRGLIGLQLGGERPLFRVWALTSFSRVPLEAAQCYLSALRVAGLRFGKPLFVSLSGSSGPAKRSRALFGEGPPSYRRIRTCRFNITSTWENGTLRFSRRTPL